MPAAHPVVGCQGSHVWRHLPVAAPTSLSQTLPEAQSESWVQPQLPAERQNPSVHSPHVPPQPSEPQVLPKQLGVQVVHLPNEHDFPPVHVPQEPPQRSPPHSRSRHWGVHVDPESTEDDVPESGFVATEVSAEASFGGVSMGPVSRGGVGMTP